MDFKIGNTVFHCVSQDVDMHPTFSISGGLRVRVRRTYRFADKNLGIEVELHFEEMGGSLEEAQKKLDEKVQRIWRGR